MATYTGYNGWTFHDYDLDDLWRKTDAQLESVKLSSSATILRINIGASEERDAKARYAAADYIISQRKKHSKERDVIKNSRVKKREELLLNLKAAHTPNGQLVAGILYDEGAKNAEEIHSWCDELFALEDRDFEKLLFELCEDQVIYQTGDQRYNLNRICVKDLLFFNSEFVNWALKKISKSKTGSSSDFLSYESGYQSYLEVVDWAIKPFCYEDILETVDLWNNVHDVKISDSSIFSKIKEFVRMGILLQQDDWFYVPFLGEERKDA